MVDREIPDNPFDTVLSDNHQGAHLATSHLVRLGHKRIGWITGPLDLLSSVQRLSGYRQALADAALLYPEELVYNGDFRPPSGMAAFRQLFSLPDPPTSIFACNDMMAIGVLRAAVEAGVRVPQDLALVGFDNIEISQFAYPALTTIAQQKDEIGRQAVQRIIELISGAERDSRKILVPTRLVVRESCGARLQDLTG
jgi:LacI family transcriptional regulator